MASPLRQPPLSIDLAEARRIVEAYERDGGLDVDAGEEVLLLRYLWDNQDLEARALAERFDQALKHWSK